MSQMNPLKNVSTILHIQFNHHTLPVTPLKQILNMGQVSLFPESRLGLAKTCISWFNLQQQKSFLNVNIIVCSKTILFSDVKNQLRQKSWVPVQVDVQILISLLRKHQIPTYIIVSIIRILVQSQYDIFRPPSTILFVYYFMGRLGKFLGKALRLGQAKALRLGAQWPHG